MTSRLTPLLLASALSLSAGGKGLPPGRAEAPRQTGCESFGPGFVKAEGTDTCIKLGGSVRVEYGVNTSGSSFFPDRR